jgi:hypothetical protein
MVQHLLLLPSCFDIPSLFHPGVLSLGFWHVMRFNVVIKSIIGLHVAFLGQYLTERVKDEDDGTKKIYSTIQLPHLPSAHLLIQKKSICIMYVP